MIKVITDVDSTLPRLIDFVPMDCASNMVNAQEILASKYPWWTMSSCGLHVVSTVLERFAEHPCVSEILDAVTYITDKFTAHHFECALLKKTSAEFNKGRSLAPLRSARNRFGSVFSGLHRIIRLKPALQVRGSRTRLPRSFDTSPCRPACTAPST
jgi:hypothetical protein